MHPSPTEPLSRFPTPESKQTDRGLRGSRDRRDPLGGAVLEDRRLHSFVEERRWSLEEQPWPSPPSCLTWSILSPWVPLSPPPLTLLYCPSYSLLYSSFSSFLFLFLLLPLFKLPHSDHQPSRHPRITPVSGTIRVRWRQSHSSHYNTCPQEAGPLPHATAQQQHEQVTESCSGASCSAELILGS